MYTFIFLMFLMPNQIECETNLIYIDEVNQYIEWDSLNQTIELNLPNNERAVYKITECKGSGELKIYSRNGKVRVEGTYTSSLALFSTYATVHNFDTGTDSIQILNYYAPIKNGDWLYFSKHIRRVEITHYENGVIINNNSHK